MKQAQNPLHQALEIFVEFSDEHSAQVVLNNLKDVYQATQDNSLLTEVARCLNATVEEVTQLFDALNNNSSD